MSEMNMSEVTICYGMTETSPVSFQSSWDDPIERKVTTVGRVHPHVTVKVIDPQGDTVPRGTPGEICTKGYNVMLGINRCHSPSSKPPSRNQTQPNYSLHYILPYGRQFRHQLLCFCVLTSSENRVFPDSGHIFKYFSYCSFMAIFSRLLE